MGEENRIKEVIITLSYCSVIEAVVGGETTKDLPSLLSNIAYIVNSMAI